ncbi:MAG: potassium-transporting ATPase subunit KdpA, partial [Actinobacteria bacterium]
MPLTDVIRLAVPCALVFALVKPLGTYLYHVFEGRRTFLHPALAPVERLLYRLTGVDADSDMGWLTYAGSLIAFSLVCFVALFALLRLQGLLGFDPAAAPGMSTAVAFNTAVSFVTNTNWQVYAGEGQVGYLTQMLGLTWQNFVSAAAGISVAVALTRGLVRRECRGIGNFWVDLTRACLYVLLPVALVLAIALASQGVVQTLAPAAEATTLEGARQTIARGPVASQEAIKQLGTNGGGFFNANSAHPFENPTPLTNLLEIVALLAIPAALTYFFGLEAGDTRQGWVLFAAMAVLFAVGLGAMYAAERTGDPNLVRAGADTSASADRPGGNMEGKEVRFGIADSVAFANSTTAVSCGAVNASHDSLTPLAGMVAMLNIALGEIVFGGAGSGLYGMLVFAILAVFIAGLMVGRTPEYLGKKIGPTEMKLAMLAVLVLEAGILVMATIGVASPAGLAARLNQGPHGLSEILYAATSAAGNNGSAFAGLDATGPLFTYGLGVLMLAGRFLFIVPVLAIAGSMACKRVAPKSPGTFPTDG